MSFIFSVVSQVELASKWGGASEPPEPPLPTGLLCLDYYLTSSLWILSLLAFLQSVGISYGGTYV